MGRLLEDLVPGILSGKFYLILQGNLFICLPTRLSLFLRLTKMILSESLTCSYVMLKNGQKYF